MISCITGLSLPRCVRSLLYAGRRPTVSSVPALSDGYAMIENRERVDYIGRSGKFVIPRRFSFNDKEE